MAMFKFKEQLICFFEVCTSFNHYLMCASGQKSLSSRICKDKNYYSALKYFIMDRFAEYFCIIILNTQKAIGGVDFTK